MNFYVPTINLTVGNIVTATVVGHTMIFVGVNVRIPTLQHYFRASIKQHKWVNFRIFYYQCIITEN